MNTETTFYFETQHPPRAVSMESAGNASAWECDIDFQEKLWVEQAKRGNQNAFDSLIRKHRLNILRVTRKITTHKEDAEDAAQETILRAFQCLTQFKGVSKFSTWLTSIAVNQSLMTLRKRRNSRTISLVSETEENEYVHEPIDARLNPEQSCCKGEIDERLQRAIDRLPQSLRSVVVLRYIDNLSTEEAAVVLGISVNAVKSRVHRARVTLRDRLQSYMQNTLGGRIEWESALR